MVLRFFGDEASNALATDDDGVVVQTAHRPLHGA